MAQEKVGRYEVIGELGKGAMGLVYKALDPTIGRTVALKTMRTDVHGMESEEMLKRFQNEARAAGVLNHPNLITVYDAGEQDGLFYIAMEMMEGITLHSMLVQQHTLPAEKIIEISRQVLAGLDYAHAHGVIHRDVKPANIMIAADGTAKIMDFGIAKAGGGMTSAGQVLGTPNYMAPEQVKGRPLDGRSDLFSYGVILYEMATGEKPFTGQNVTTIIYKIIHEEPIPPRELDVTIHPGLSAVIQRALAKNPDERYQRGSELTRDLENYKSLGGTGDTTSVIPPAQPFPMGMDSNKTVAMPSTGAQQEAVARAEAMAAAAGGVAVATAPGSGSYPVMAEPPAPPALPKLDNVSSLPKKAPARAAGPNRTRQVLVGVLVLVMGVAAFFGWRMWQERQAQNVAQAEIGVAPTNTTPTPDPTTATPTNTTTPPANTQTTPPPPKPSAAKGTTTPPPRPSTAGMVSLSSKPAGAHIFIDGHDSGKVTPAQFAAEKGEHEIKLKKDGYKDITTKATIKPGGTFAYSPTLEAGSNDSGFGKIKHIFGGGDKIPEGKGEIKVKAHPKEAKITVDGKALDGGKGFFSPGKHQLTVSAGGYKTLQKTVTVEAGKAAELEETLVKK